jgi:hypothetical protein
MEGYRVVLQWMTERVGRIKADNLSVILFCCMVVGYYYFGHLDFIGTLSLGVVSLFALFLISCCNSCIRSSGTFPNPHVTISALLLLALGLYVLNEAEYEYLLKSIVIPIITIFAVRGAVKSARQANRALVIIAIIVSISCVVAFLQALDIDYFWNLRMMYGAPSLGVRQQLIDKVRAVGLAYYVVPLSYQISAIFPFVIYLAFISRARALIVILGICIVLGALGAKSLSSFLAILVSYIIFIKLNHLLSLKKMFGFIMILLFLVIGVSYFNDFASRITEPEFCSVSRIPSTLIGTEILSTHPFGVESRDELVNLVHYYKTDYSILLDGTRARTLLRRGFHNCMLTAGITYGWAILIVYIWLYLYIFWFAYKAMKNSAIGSADYYFYSGAIAYFCAYIIQSSTHSTGLTTGDPYDWIIIGIILAYKPSRISSDECRNSDEKA